MRHGGERKVAALVSLTLALAARDGAGAGFLINEHDARATGRAGAVIASPTSPSTIFFNPAGIAPLDGVQLTLGGAVVVPRAEFEPLGGGPKTEADSQANLLPHLYGSGRLTELLSLGVGVNAPFGLALRWPATSPGRAQVREAELRTLFITPTVGLELSRWAPGLSVGVGLDLVPSSVRLIRDVPFGDAVGSAALSGSAFGVGARVGVLYRPLRRPDWAFGVTYKSPVVLDFEGEADFTAPAIYRPSLPPDGPGGTSITLPQSLMLGVSFRPTPEWELEVDGGVVGWSSYDRLDITLPDGTITRSNRNWHDSVVLRAGTEYTFAGRWMGRFGVIFDQAPVPKTTLDFQLADAPRFDLTAGFGALLTPEVQVDVGALWVLPSSATTSLADPLSPPIKGTFEIEAWVFNVSVAVSFGAEPSRLQPFPTTAPAAPGESPLFEPQLPDSEDASTRCRRFPGVRALQHQQRCPDDAAPATPQAPPAVATPPPLPAPPPPPPPPGAMPPTRPELGLEPAPAPAPEPPAPEQP